MVIRSESGDYTFSWTVPHLRDESSALAFVRRFRHEPMAISAFRRMLMERGMLDPQSARSDDKVLARVAKLLASGQLATGVQTVLGRSALQLDTEERPVRRQTTEDASRPAQAVKTWVEFQVVDTDDKPVSGKAYKVMLPDGTIEEGVLPANGTVRYSGIDPGTAVFMLTDLDADAWQKVG